MEQMFFLFCENPNINKSARFLIVAETEKEAREKYEKTWVAQSGMMIKTMSEIGQFYMLD